MAEPRRPDAPRSAAVIEPLAIELLARPLDFLHGEHYRQRCVLGHLDQLAATDSDAARRAIAKAVLDFLKQDLPIHIADEEMDLFPRLRAQCAADDNVDALLGILTAEHEADEALAQAVATGLEQLLAGPRREITGELQAAIRAYVETQRRHLAWENAIILPLAAKRLQPADLRAMARSMAVRRGVAPPRTDRKGLKALLGG